MVEFKLTTIDARSSTKDIVGISVVVTDGMFLITQFIMISPIILQSIFAKLLF